MKTYYINKRALAHRSSNGEYLVCSPEQLEASGADKKDFIEVTVREKAPSQFETFNKNLLEVERLIGMIGYMMTEIRGVIRR